MCVFNGKCRKIVHKKKHVLCGLLLQEEIEKNNHAKTLYVVLHRHHADVKRTRNGKLIGTPGRLCLCV